MLCSLFDKKEQNHNNCILIFQKLISCTLQYNKGPCEPSDSRVVENHCYVFWDLFEQRFNDSVSISYPSSHLRLLLHFSPKRGHSYKTEADSVMTCYLLIRSGRPLTVSAKVCYGKRMWCFVMDESSNALARALTRLLCTHALMSCSTLHQQEVSRW